VFIRKLMFFKLLVLKLSQKCTYFLSRNALAYILYVYFSDHIIPVHSIAV